MPVVGHQTVGKNTHWVAQMSLDHDPLESVIVLGFLQQGQPGHRPVEDVVHQAARCNAGLPGHERRHSPTRRPEPVVKTSYVPFPFLENNLRRREPPLDQSPRRSAPMGAAKWAEGALHAKAGLSGQERPHRSAGPTGQNELRFLFLAFSDVRW